MLEFREAGGSQAAGGSWAKKQAELREDCGGGASRRVFEGDPEVQVTIDKM